MMLTTMAEPSLAYRDELTGAFNRRYLTHLFDERWAELRRVHERMAVIMVDLDSFKAINDSYGHAVGDEALRATAGLLRDHFRQSDSVIRLGGDEFVVIAPGVGSEEAQVLAERARETGSGSCFVIETDGKSVEAPIEFSIGVASYPTDGDDGESVLAAADSRLYVEKHQRHRRDRWSRHGKLLAVAVLFAIVGGLVNRQLSAQLLAPPLTHPQVSIGVDEQATAALTSSPALLAETVSAEPTPDPRIDALLAQIEELTRERDEALVNQQRVAVLEATVRDLRQARGEAAPTPRRSSPVPVAVVPRTTPLDLPSQTAAATPTPRPTPEPAAQPTATPIAELPVVVGPQLVRAARPIYPSIAHELRREATVRVRVTIGVDGRPTAASAVEKIGFGFEEAAENAALRSRFAPGQRDGKPVVGTVVMKFKFDL